LISVIVFGLICLVAGGRMFLGMQGFDFSKAYLICQNFASYFAQI